MIFYLPAEFKYQNRSKSQEKVRYLGFVGLYCSSSGRCLTLCLLKLLMDRSVNFLRREVSSNFAEDFAEFSWIWCWAKPRNYMFIEVQYLMI